MSSTSYGWYTPTEAYYQAHAYLFGAREMQSPSPSSPLVDQPRPSTSSDRTVTAELPSPTHGNVPAFATLLAYDPARYANDGYRYSLKEDGLTNYEREVIPLGKNTGLVGRDRHAVLHELNRLRNAKAIGRRKRLAALAGSATLVVTGATGWMMVSDIISLIRLSQVQPAPDQLRFGFLVASLVCRSLAFVGQCLVLIWCRYARRPSVAPLARPLFLLALLCFLLHLTLAIVNFFLVVLWKASPVSGRSVRDRCEWGIDLLWQLGDGAKLCTVPYGSTEAGDLVPWLSASCVRMLVVLIVGTGWMHVIRLFNRSVTITSIVDPNAAPDEYMRSLLEKHSADIVPLDDATLVARSTAYNPQAGMEYLPPMPERRRMLRTEDEEELESLKKTQGSLGGMLMNAVGWLFGTTKYEGVKERPESTYRNSLLFEDVEKTGAGSPVTAEATHPETFGKTTRAYPTADDDAWADQTFDLEQQQEQQDRSETASSWNPFAIGRKWFSGPTSSAQYDAPLPPAKAAESSSAEQQYYDPDAYRYTSPFANNPLHPDYIPPQPASKRPSSSASSVTIGNSYPVAPATPSRAAARSSYHALFDGLKSPSRARTNSNDPQSSPPVPPARSDMSGPAVKPLPLAPTPGAMSAFREHLDQAPAMFPHAQSGLASCWAVTSSNEIVEYDPETSFEIDEEELADVHTGHQRQPSGSVVYIRMSDGRLVRKLSTIISENESMSRENSLASMANTPERGPRDKPLPGGWKGSE